MQSFGSVPEERLLWLRCCRFASAKKLVSYKLKFCINSTSMSLKECLRKMYGVTLVYLFGLASTTLITVLTKLLVGRHRPHFYQVYFWVEKLLYNSLCLVVIYSAANRDRRLIICRHNNMRSTQYLSYSSLCMNQYSIMVAFKTAKIFLFFLSN